MGNNKVFREATVNDIGNMSRIRISVKENVLNNPALVTQKDYIDYLTSYGKGWICEIDNEAVGFAIASLTQNNIWALFIDPAHEEKGIGKELHRMMMDWYFSKTAEKVWLNTDPGTRAELFYRKQGWTAKGMHGNEIRFEMTYSDWTKK